MEVAATIQHNCAVMVGLCTARYSCLLPCHLHFGSRAELPRLLQPGSWTPAPDPAIVVRSDCVEIRRIHVTFRVHLENDLDQDGRKIWWGRKIDHDTLHRVLSARLRFA